MRDVIKASLFFGLGYYSTHIVNTIGSTGRSYMLSVLEFQVIVFSELTAALSVHSEFEKLALPDGLGHFFRNGRMAG